MLNFIYCTSIRKQVITTDTHHSCWPWCWQHCACRTGLCQLSTWYSALYWVLISYIRVVETRLLKIDLLARSGFHLEHSLPDFKWNPTICRWQYW